MPPATEEFRPAIPGFSYADLHDPHRLAALTERFHAELRSADPALAVRWAAYAANEGEGIGPVEESDLLVAVGGHLSRFVAAIFGVENECRELELRAGREHSITAMKKEFFIRRVIRRIDRTAGELLNRGELERRVNDLIPSVGGLPPDDPELAAAGLILEFLRHERFAKTELPEGSRLFVARCAAFLLGKPAWAHLLPASESEPELRAFLTRVMQTLEEWLASLYYSRDAATGGWVTFRVPQPMDYFRLVERRVLEGPVPNCTAGPEERYRRRDGFDLTDPRYSYREVSGEVSYCIFCHDREKDSCRKGFPEGDGFRRNPLGFTLKGCPLGQKISESHLLRERGDSLGALSIIMIDNPLLPGTGHRICNDCMKACIFQKQDPVNIPQAETRILMDVLELPWGFEIYSLLTRWNPLNVKRPHPLPYNGMKILVVGMGPAGYTLAHYFLNEGFGVAGIDGLKIEPLPEDLAGSEGGGFRPIRDYRELTQKLSDRVLTGFGGVSEYGITVRWDKNFLTVLYLNLLRRTAFRIYGGVRFGGTMTVEDAWEYGFDHVCFATGAGKPTFVSMKNNLIRGIRKASDFLMALQLTGAGKRDSMANLQVQLPAVVIGGGLTAIDTATELMAYYPAQVEKIRHRYDALVERYGTEAVEGMFDPGERSRLAEFLAHAREVEKERNRAAAAGESPDFITLVRKWGGVHVYYRKGLTDSPAYRLNHEEIIKGFEEGFTFVEKMNPLEAVPDETGAVGTIVFERQEQSGGKWRGTGEVFRVPARTVMVAAGTVPNIMYEKEHPGTFALGKWNDFFRMHRIPAPGELPVGVEEGGVGFFTSYHREGKYVSFYGDNHPEFAGNVVKAMASAKEGFREVIALFRERLAAVRADQGGATLASWHAFARGLDADLVATIVRVDRLTPTITEIVVHAPKGAAQFQPGQFFRLQNYEVDSPRIAGTLVMLEGVALTGAWVDREKGDVGLIALEVGASSRMCALLRPGQRVVLMGPTGAPTEISENGTVILLGGGLGNAVLFSIARAFEEKGNRVVYFAGYKKREDLFKREEIEAATDVVVYSVDAGEMIPVHRPQDRTFRGNIVEAMLAYAKGELGPVSTPLSDAGRVIAIGSDRMMAAVTQARHGVLQPYLKPGHAGIVSINSPMQCMMKAICAQCLQRHIDPVTGKEEFVFTCANQDQEMDQVDFANLNARLRQNGVMEKLTARWLDYLFEKGLSSGV